MEKFEHVNLPIKLILLVFGLNLFCLVYILTDWVLIRVYFRPNQESQKIFKAAQPMDATQVKTKLIGYGFSLLEGVDPNPEVKNPIYFHPIK